MKRLSSLFRPEPAKEIPAKPQSDERRIQPRFTTQFRSTFSGNKQEGQGRTLDISAGGCKIESDMKVEPGSKLECRLHVPGLDWPLRIDEATVRWVDGHSFGIAFSRIAQEEVAKLKTVLSDLEGDE
ncbi:MAG: hypothetical protein Nkreftii_003549 [Candidatus Nitrospira kreftii]|uniref:PilZ domain-containing protein n=1 Tax=Candidatus Nitrospira kreftii TaxID=2652173 RepID=A0A7S8J1K4_9BACT|nr:MAG: hypothetical protein Nkreftii_003549 [Candidatus Nitrospira kreftii]